MDTTEYDHGFQRAIWTSAQTLGAVAHQDHIDVDIVYFNLPSTVRRWSRCTVETWRDCGKSKRQRARDGSRWRFQDLLLFWHAVSRVVMVFMMNEYLMVWSLDVVYSEHIYCIRQIRARDK